MITLIKESNLYLQSFGFKKATSDPVPTGGKKPPDLHAEIAEAMFITPPDATYTKDDLEVLTTAVGNRISACVPVLINACLLINEISSLKKGYRDHRTLLGATGQGLVSEDREGEIEHGSELENIWGNVFFFCGTLFCSLLYLRQDQEKISLVQTDARTDGK